MILATIIAALVGISLTVLVIKLLGWQRIKDWFVGYFKNRHKIKNPDEIAFTLKENLANNKVKVVQGIFNQTTDKIEDGLQYEAEKLDDTLSEYHKNEQVVVYQ